MNKFRNVLSETANSITTEKDIVSTAMEKALQCRDLTVKKRKAVRFGNGIGRAVPAVLAAAMICGVTVSAVKAGWLELIFGPSAELITVNGDMYSMNIENFEITGNIPGIEKLVSVQDIICDGEAMYVSMRIDGLDIETAQRYADRFSVIPQITSADGCFKGTTQYFKEDIIDHGDNYIEAYIALSTSDGLGKGDRVMYTIFTPDIAGSMPVMSNKKTEGDFTVSFEIAEEPSDCSKVIEIGIDADLTDSHSNSSGKFFIDKITLSPLRFMMTGRAYSGSKSYASPENICFVMKDGSRIPIESISDSYGGSVTGEGEIETDCYLTRVLQVGDVQSIEIGNITVGIE